MPSDFLKQATPAQMLDLFDHASESDERERSDTTSLWRDHLRRPLIFFIQDKQASRDLADYGTLGQLLTADRPPAEAVRFLAKWAKAVAASSGSALPEDSARVLYYLLTWVGRYRCGGGLSTLSDEKLRHGLAWSARRDWLDSETQELIAQMLKNMHN